MIWNTASDAERLAHLAECRKAGMSWVAITRALHTGMLRIMPYRLQLPDSNVRCGWRNNGDGKIHCSGCGMIVETAGPCELCEAQGEGRVFLYRELEKVHV